MQLLLREHQKLRMRRINVRDLVLCGPYRIKYFMLAAAKYYELHLSPLSKVVRLSQRTTQYVHASLLYLGNG